MLENRPAVAFAVVAALAAAFAIHFWRKSSGLEDRLAATSVPPAESAAPVAGETTSPEPAPRLGSSSSPFRFGRQNATPSDRQTLPDAPKESRRQRRLRIQDQIAGYFGRIEGETDEEYVARLKPAIEGMLAAPREKLEDARAEIERLAKITDEQRGEIDSIFDDGMAEAMELANSAIEAGDITPYERNWSGIGQTLGGLSAILGSTETRVAGILSPEQLQIISEAGFEWGEYLALKTPWQNLNPPPTPPGDDG